MSDFSGTSMGPGGAGLPLVEPGSGDLVGGRYQLGEPLGLGQRKQVYAAHDLRMARDVALVFLEPARSGAFEDVRSAEWEARVRARLGDNPHIVSVYDIGMHEGRPYIVSQYMQGGDAAALCAAAGEGTGTPEEAIISIAKDICAALQFAHERGVIHRDLRPDNIWLDADGRAYLGDFDVALVSEDATTSSALLVSAPEYAAPEVVLGERIDGRSDLYSLGCVMFELATGSCPFEGATSEIVLNKQLSERPPVPSERGRELSVKLDSIIRKLLNKEPDHRYQTARAVERELENLLVIDSAFVEALLSGGETETVEFKSSLRYPHGKDTAEVALKPLYRALEKQVMKTVAAFRNSRGGTLLIGVDDRSAVIGLEPDFNTLSAKPDLDGWLLAFQTAAKRLLGDEVASDLDLTLVEMERGTIAVVAVSPAGDITWLRDGSQVEYYVRLGPSSASLSMPDAVAHIRRRFWLSDEAG